VEEFEEVSYHGVLAGCLDGQAHFSDKFCTEFPASVFAIFDASYFDT